MELGDELGDFLVTSNREPADDIHNTENYAVLSPPKLTFGQTLGLVYTLNQHFEDLNEVMNIIEQLVKLGLILPHTAAKAMLATWQEAYVPASVKVPKENDK